VKYKIYLFYRNIFILRAVITETLFRMRYLCTLTSVIWGKNTELYCKNESSLVLLQIIALNAQVLHSTSPSVQYSVQVLLCTSTPLLSSTENMIQLQVQEYQCQCFFLWVLLLLPSPLLPHFSSFLFLK